MKKQKTALFIFAALFCIILTVSVYAAGIKAPKLTGEVISTSGRCRLTWTKVSGAAKYEVYRSVSENGTYSKMFTTAGMSYTNTAAKPGTKYYYKVRAVDKNGGKGKFGNAVSLTCRCAQPVVSVSNASSSGAVKISWSKADGAAEYIIYRADSKSGTYKKIRTVSSLSCTDKAVKVGSTYYYKVKAVPGSGKGSSVCSRVVSRICKCARPVAECSWSSAGHPVLKWKKVSGAVSYSVYRAGSENSSYKLLANVNGTSYTDKKAAKGTLCYYKIVAVSGKSSANSAPARLCFCAKPDAPTGLKLTEKSDGNISAGWNAVKGADGYIVLCGSKKSVSSMIVYKSCTKNSCTLGKPASFGKNVYFAVTAYCELPDGSVILSEPSPSVRS